MTGNEVVPCWWQEAGLNGPMLVAGDSHPTLLAGHMGR